MKAIERESIRLTSIIRAAEDWSTEYGKDPRTHAKLIRQQAHWEIQLVKFFKGVAKKQDLFINWHNYTPQLKADYNVDIIIDDEDLDEQVGDGFMNISVELLAEIMETGYTAGTNIYDIKTGLPTVADSIQKLATDRVAALVGKKVLPDGTIIDNPNSAYSITATMRQQIADSIKASLEAGDDMATASSKISDLIDDDYRSEVIARTESVNGYQSGLAQFADDSDAVGKEWQTVGSPDDECGDNEDDGPIAIDDTFSSGDDQPTAHPNCQCGIRYIYQAEWDQINGGGDNSDNSDS